MTRVSNGFGRRRIAGNHDAAVGRVESVAHGEVPISVGDGKSGYGDVRVLVHHSGLDLVHFQFVRGWNTLFQALDSHLNVFGVCRTNVGRHVTQSDGAVNL